MTASDMTTDRFVRRTTALKVFLLWILALIPPVASSRDFSGTWLDAPVLQPKDTWREQGFALAIRLRPF